MAPNITEFNAPDLTIRPSETGVEATARAGLRLGAYGNQIAQAEERTGQALGRGVANVGEAAYQQIEHHEISAGAAHGAELIAQLNESWNATAKNADPNDASVAAKWRTETLEPALDQFRSGFLTQGGGQWAEHFVDQYRNHAVEKTSADMSTMAGVAVRENARNTLNSLTSAVFNDPSTLNFSRDALGHSLDGVIGSSATLSPADAAKVRAELTQQGQEQLVKASIMGTIVKGGDWHKIADDPKNTGFVNAPEIQAFARQERFYQRMDESEARNARVMRDYENRQNWNAAADKLELSTLPQRVGDQPTLPDDYWDQVRKIGMMPGTEPSRLESLINKGNQITGRLGKPEPLAPISHATTMDLLGKIRSGEVANTDDIYKAYGDNKLNNADFNFLTRELYERKTPEGERLDKDRDLFFKRYSLMLDPSMGEHGDRLYTAEMDARQQEQALRSQGKDPHLVYDPRSEYFFGKPENIQRYKQPLQTQLSTPAPAPPAEARRPGQVYPTPRGPMEWTGTGWVTPRAAAPAVPISR